MDDNKKNNHRIVIDSRNSVDIEGVEDVLAFDEQEVVLETDQGMLVIVGQDLHVNQLNLTSGKVNLTGVVESVNYTEDEGYSKGSFFGKLFKG